jgi:ankyrin repeat protein
MTKKELNNQLALSCHLGTLEKVKSLVEQGADIHAQNDATLRMSTSNGHLEVVKYLVEQGADINANNDTALLWSAVNGHLETETISIIQTRR